MGGRPSRQDKAMSPLSSWGGSFDDLLCGEGKICGDPWTPVPSRHGSLDLRALERRRSLASPRYAYREGYDDDFEVVRQQPLPMDVYSMRAPMEADYYGAPLLIRRRRSEYENNRPLPISERPKRVRKKKKVIRSVKKKKPRRIRRTASHVTRPPTSTRSVRRLHRVSPARLRAVSEPRRMPTQVYLGLSQSQRAPRTTVRVTRVVMRRANSENKSSIMSTKKVVPPRHLRPHGVPPPEPFRFRHLPDQPYFRIATANHPYL